MPYNLFITSAEGRTAKALRSPYQLRLDTRRTVRVVVDDGNRDEAWAFANKVADAPLGETVTHEATGVAFRTEEFTS